MTLKIEEVFESVQGEGTLSGTGALFIRLRGCNAVKAGLECAEWCDTHYAWRDAASEPLSWTSDRLEEEVARSFMPLVVFTGGEPLLQKDDLGYWLKKTKFLTEDKVIAFETNGTIKRDLPHRDKIWWTVSPKPPKYDIKSGPISEIKVVVPTEDTELWYQTQAPLLYKWLEICPRVWVQPQDNDLELAAWIADILIKDFPLVRLNLQLHKLLEVK